MAIKSEKPILLKAVLQIMAIIIFSVFVPTEVLFLLSSFSKRKTCPVNGFRRVFMATGGLIKTQKGGQAMNMGRRGLNDETRRKVGPGEYRLLICDGHDSHINGEFIAYCIDNNILLMILPPHSSHLTQPLDVGVFGALKKHMAAEIDPIVRTGVARIQKVEWLTAFVAAHDKALSVKNILGGFRGTGIHPFLPTKVLRRVASSSPPQQQTRPPTPPNPLAVFNDAVLTDSPANFNAVQQANNALNALLESGEPLPSPAKKYVGHCTRSIMRLHARNTILEKENADQKAVLQRRKNNMSGKRRVIDGKHLMTATELIGVQGAEEVTTQRKAQQKGAGKRKGRSKAKKESTDESEEGLDSTSEDDVGILDCIVVEK